VSTEVIMAKIPNCDLPHVGPKPPAAVDAKMRTGPWAYMCEPCFRMHGLGRLGTGYGQRLVLAEPEPVKDVPDAEVLSVRIGGQQAGCSDVLLVTQEDVDAGQADEELEEVLAKVFPAEEISARRATVLLLLVLARCELSPEVAAEMSTDALVVHYREVHRADLQAGQS
jgi:hypothetical protein